MYHTRLAKMMIVYSAITTFLFICRCASIDTDDTTALSHFQIEGKVVLPRDARVPADWKSYSRVLVNYGEYVGFIR
jgi:hypothetical protein